ARPVRLFPSSHRAHTGENLCAWHRLRRYCGRRCPQSVHSVYVLETRAALSCAAFIREPDRRTDTAAPRRRPCSRRSRAARSVAGGVLLREPVSSESGYPHDRWHPAPVNGDGVPDTTETPEANAARGGSARSGEEDRLSDMGRVATREGLHALVATRSANRSARRACF